MKFMLCYDGSEACNDALKVAREYAKRFSADLHVISSRSEQEDGAEQGLGGVRDELEKDGVDCVVESLAHDMTDGENLVDYARREAVDAVFIGVRRISKVGKLLFGSTAQYVILSAPCPVISVRAGVAGEV